MDAREKELRTKSKSDTNACVRDTKNPMMNTALTPILRWRRCFSSSALQSLQDLDNVVTAIKTHGSVKGIMNPAGGNIVV